MKNNLYEDALDGVEDVVNEVSQGIADEFKKAKPFDKEPIPNDQLLQAYVNLTPQDMQMFMQKYPKDVLEDFIFDMEDLKDRRLGNG